MRVFYTFKEERSEKEQYIKEKCDKAIHHAVHHESMAGFDLSDLRFRIHIYAVGTSHFTIGEDAPQEVTHRFVSLFKYYLDQEGDFNLYEDRIIVIEYVGDYSA